MKRLLLAAGLVVISAAAYADSQFWVVGNQATNRCDIVTRNPLISGDIWFGDGPYKSIEDARLARSTIGRCPNKEETDDKPVD